MHPKIAEYFDDDDLEEEYGGTLSSQYDHDIYFEAERRHWQRQRELQAAQRRPAPAIEEDAIVTSVSSTSLPPSELSSSMRSLESALSFDVDSYLSTIVGPEATWF